jgi:hypothetical protein
MATTRRQLLAGLSAVATMSIAGVLAQPQQQSSPTGAGRSQSSITEQVDSPSIMVESAEIESSGWVLAVTGRWPASTFADFALDPDGLPRISLRLWSPGHELADTRLVGTVRPREVVATKTLRRSVPGPPMDIWSLDEAELPDGRRRLRIALSNYIHAGDTIESLDFREGWRTGASAQTLSARNASLKPVELPTMRWIVPARMVVTAASTSIRAEILVASNWAEGLSAVAAVELAATDGFQWNRSMQVKATKSSGTVDEFWCWGVALPELLEGLASGPVTIHAKIYPWIGAARATGNQHATDPEACFGLSAETPLTMIWDPDGTHMPEAHVFVDPVAGSSIASLVRVGRTLAEAKDGVAAATLSVAAQAVYLANRTIAAKNGWAASNRAGDNAILSLARGTHRFGTQAVSLGASTSQGRMIIQGDPDVVDRASACVLDLGDVPAWRYSAMLCRHLSLRVGADRLPFSAAATHFEKVRISARPGFEDSRVGIVNSTATKLKSSFSGCMWSNTAVTLRAARVSFIRSCQIARSISAAAIVNSRKIDDGSDGFMVGNVAIAGEVNSGHDQMIWGNLFYGCRNTCLYISGTDITGHAPRQHVHRFRLINNLFEVCPPRGKNFSGIGALPTSRNIGSLGEGGYLSAIDCLVENNTFVGQRFSWGYNDPPTNDPRLQHRHSGTVFRNNYTDRSATKHDTFSDSIWGYRPGFTDSWSILYGVGNRTNVIGLRWSGHENFEYEFDGLGIVRSATPGLEQGNSWTRFADDRSQSGLATDQNGYGNYSPEYLSPLVGLCRNGNALVDPLGRQRQLPFAAGSYA